MSAQAQRTPRGFLDRIIGIAVVLGGFAKFFAFFVSFAAYSLWFHSWRFGLGLVLLILVHELGHFFEARRQGLPVTLPTFIPFFGAFVTHRQASATNCSSESASNSILGTCGLLYVHVSGWC